MTFTLFSSLKNILYSLLLVFSSSGALLSFSVSHAETTSTPTTLRFGSLVKEKPFFYYEDNKVSGIIAEVIKSALSQIGYQTEFAYYPPPRLSAYITEQKIDIMPLLYPDEAINVSIKETMVFSQEVMFSIKYGILSLENDSLNLDLKGNLKNYKTGTLRLPHLSEEQLFQLVGEPLNQIAFGSHQQMLKALLGNRIDLAMTSLYMIPTAEELGRKSTSKLVIKKHLPDLHVRIGISQLTLGDEAANLVSQFDKQIQTMKQTGEIEKIIGRHSDPKYFTLPSH
jgi:ABC-type amino acid transport substrate-binding protein